MREFETGATRDSDDGKYDYEGFLSPRVLRRFAAYMHKHRAQVDGSLRSSDNWQKGIPKDVYMKSMWRHFMDVWTFHRSTAQADHEDVLEDALCGVLFNVQGYLHELLRERAEAMLAPINTAERPNERLCNPRNWVDPVDPAQDLSDLLTKEEQGSLREDLARIAKTMHPCWDVT